jgi:hypothetical protein
MGFRRFILIGCLAPAFLAGQAGPPAERPADPLIVRARQSVVAAAENLPDFVCQEITTRYRKNLSDGSWQQRDTLSADMAYALKTGESYSNVLVNGAPASKGMLDLPGPDSPVELGLDLRYLFGSAANDDFHFNEEVALNGKAARVFSYEVDGAASHWKIKDHNTSVTAAYEGRIWVDKALGQVMRLEMIADGLPNPTANQVTTTIDYEPIDLGDGRKRLLPVGSETLFCKKETGACDRDTTEFRNYRPLRAASEFAFGDIPKEFGLDAATSAGAGVSGTRGASRGGPMFSLVGVLRPPHDKQMVLELDDTRYLLFTARGNARVGLSVGDRVRIESNDYDGHSLVADSFSVVQAAVNPASTKPAAPLPAADPIIEKAREGAKTLVLQLPNFLCTEEVKRYRNGPKHKQWLFEDTLSAEVIYSGRTGEDYRDVRVNGKSTTKQWMELSGDVSTGEFGSLLRSLLSTRSTEFKFKQNDKTNGSPAREYSFLVARAESDWMIMSDYQFIIPAYSGQLWFDQDSNQVLRIERRAEDIPSAFPISSIETEVTFGLVHLSPSESYVLPLHAETKACVRENGECRRKTIDFRNYKKFSGESKIIY